MLAPRRAVYVDQEELVDLDPVRLPALLRLTVNDELVNNDAQYRPVALLYALVHFLGLYKDQLLIRVDIANAECAQGCHRILR